MSLDSRKLTINADATPAYERRDVPVRWVILVLGILFIAGFAMHGMVARVMVWLRGSALSNDASQPKAGGRAHRQSNSPIPYLQVSPPLDLKSFRSREDAELNTPAWIDRSAGIVRLPIEEAINVVLKEGLPVRSGTNANNPGITPEALIRKRSEERKPDSSQ
jgi:hypothetical protein